MTGILDLFGDPISDGHGKRGRPPHVVTNENRNKVKMLLAFSWSNDRIANALHISTPSFRKHYFVELKLRDVMRDRLTASSAMRLWGLFETGNVAAFKEFQRLVDRNDAPLLRAQAQEDDDEADAVATAATEVARWDDVAAANETVQ